ncbi:MAG: hypothetical protein FD145_137 [Candidatus Saganbacteria bacterium]|uniref:DUF218 domain-containing protein n=1 Tax=Candidatus Saganbacteria bacterium TaxID=2575572 RepID=A0A833L2K2_UNCSA|nr:MAG: hypothetical protein FD145_137 [Candidatus Saganbacteria bacterium]
MKLKNKVVVIALVIIGLILAAPLVLQKMADYLVVQDKLEKSDVILVLAGDPNGERVSQAVKLYKDKWAPKILMSGGPAVWHLTYAENMKEQAKSYGIPDKDIYLEDKSESTYEDIKFSLDILRKLEAKKIIIISSPYHMRRMSLTARKMYLKHGIKTIVYPVQKSKWNKEKWWLSHEDTQPVIYEYMALVQYLLKGWLL